MLHCNKNRNKSIDINCSISDRLRYYRFKNAYKSITYMFDPDSWSDIRLLETMDKTYGNHR